MPGAPALASVQKQIFTITLTLVNKCNHSQLQCSCIFWAGLHLGLLLDVFEQRLDGMRTRLSQCAKWVLLQSRSMKLAKLHRPHVSWEEGLPQLQCWDGVLLKTQIKVIKLQDGLRLTGHGIVYLCMIWFSGFLHNVYLPEWCFHQRSPSGPAVWGSKTHHWRGSTGPWPQAGTCSVWGRGNLMSVKYFLFCSTTFPLCLLLYYHALIFFIRNHFFC